MSLSLPRTNMAKTCPLMKGPCIEHDCVWYIQLFGTNPQTGIQMSEWGCTMAAIPLLLIESAKETRHFAAAAESARNEARLDTRAMVATLQEVASKKRLK